MFTHKPDQRLTLTGHTHTLKHLIKCRCPACETETDRRRTTTQHKFTLCSFQNKSLYFTSSSFYIVYNDSTRKTTLEWSNSTINMPNNNKVKTGVGEFIFEEVASMQTCKGCPGALTNKFVFIYISERKLLSCRRQQFHQAVAGKQPIFYRTE